MQVGGFDAGLPTLSSCVLYPVSLVPYLQSRAAVPLDGDAVVFSLLQGNRDDLEFDTAGDQQTDMAAPHGYSPKVYPSTLSVSR